MKRFMMTAAAALLATGAAAQGVAPTIVDQVENELGILGIDVPVSTLSDEQIVQIYVLTSSGDRSVGVEEDRILGIIDQEADSAAVADAMDDEEMILREERRAMMVIEGENSVVTSVQNFLDANGFEVDASDLPDDVVAEIYFEAFSDSDSPTRDEIETLIAS